MKRPLLLLLALLLAACAPGLFSCGGDAEEENEGERLHIIGTVEYINLEGGFFGIVGEDGQRYDPADLPAEFRQNGLPVEVQAVPLRDRVSFHQWGQLIAIDKISRR